MGWACDAFSGGIPTDILASVKDHREPHEGDGGLRFQPKDGSADSMPQLATDPPVSEAQRRAMWAAAAGHSTSGIPQSVGREFASADPGGKLPARAKDMNPVKWATLKRLFGEWINEEAAEPEHGEDNLWSHDGRRVAKDAWGSWERRGRAASVAFTTHDGRVLLLRRAKDEENWPDTWAFPGGKADDGEDFEECARREAREECGDCGAMDDMSELERTRTPNDYEHVTYVVPVKEPFEPRLSGEHQAFAWYPATDLPDHVHPGVRAAIDRVINADESEETKKRNEGKLSQRTREEIGRVGSTHRQDMPDSDFLEPESKKYPVKKEGKYDHGLLLAAAREARMHGHEELAKRADAIREREFPSAAKDEAIDVLAFDWSRGAILSVHEPDHAYFAFDKGSVRDKDSDGRLHISEANISKANVCPYYGYEIPDHEKLGLDPAKRYMLLRDPDELKRAAPTFNNLPILSTHVPVTADSFPQDKIIGSTGTDAEFRGPYLQNSLVFWPQEAIDDIESEAKKELSAGYRYRADMTPGTFKGVHYDGVMRDIKGNHLVLVKEGRAGADVVVGDAALGSKEEDMRVQLSPKAALAAGTFLGTFGSRLKTRGMAMDAASDLFTPIFAGITARNFAAQRPILDAALRAALKGKMANDADIEEVTRLLEQIEGVEAGADTTTEANAGLPSYMMEDPEDADDETPEEREEDEGCDRRARDARHRLGRDARDEELERIEEEEEDPKTGEEAEDRRRADDARRRADDLRARRADDARRLLGRDESEEEREKREEREEADDRRHARDRRVLGRDYRRARDAHHEALDAWRKSVADWRRAHDGHKKAMDAKHADDAARHARDMARADDECKEAMDRVKRARDARRKARDARRAHDKRHGVDRRADDRRGARDDMGVRGETVTKEAMDAAIRTSVSEAIAANDRKHREISDAIRAVRPKAGDIAMDSGINSASDVYARALDVLGVDHAGVRDAVALRKMFEIAPRPGGEPRSGGFAHDSAPSATAYQSFAARFPNAAKIEH